MIEETKAKAYLEQISRRGQEPSFLSDLRFSALKAARQLPEPPNSPLTKRMEANGLDLFSAPEEWPLCLLGSTELSEWEKEFRADAESRLQFVNGRKAVHCLSTELACHGILFSDLALAARMFPQLVVRYLCTVAPYKANRWTALQTALWSEGLFLYIPKNVQAELPLQAWWRRTAGGGHLHPRALVVAEEGSQVALLLGESSELEEPAVSLGLTEVIAEEGAHVRLTSVHRQDAQMTRIHFLRAKVARDARVEVLFADLGEGYHKIDVTAELAGDGAEATLDAVCMGSGNRQLDLTLTAHHIGRYTKSRMRGHALVAEKAQAKIRAVSKIDKGASKANSVQEERMILLDSRAQAQAVPTLLIEEEDVQCDHALSVGPLGYEALFYLMTRGLTESDAKRLLLRGFLQPLAERMPFSGLQTALNDWLDEHVGGVQGRSRG
jgi:Fe-S cluster assembly protein SufD